MKHIYFCGYSHSRGFGSFAVECIAPKNFKDFCNLVDYIKEEIHKARGYLKDEIVIISISKIDLVDGVENENKIK